MLCGPDHPRTLAHRIPLLPRPAPAAPGAGGKFAAVLLLQGDWNISQVFKPTTWLSIYNGLGQDITPGRDLGVLLGNTVL